MTQVGPGVYWPADPADNEEKNLLKCVVSGDRYYSGLTKDQIADLKALLRLENPDYTSLIKFSKSPAFILEKQLATIPRLLNFWDEPKLGVFQVPRGYILPGIKKEVANVQEPKAKFPKLQIQPRDWQGDALKVFDGIKTPVFDTTIEAPPGNGKTVFGCLVMAKLGMRTLVLVHKENILDAWVADLKLAFGKDFEPAIVKGKSKEIGDTVTIAMMQTLKNMDPEDYNVFGLVICDEAHHCPASTYLDLLCNTESKYRLGLTATPKRSDGLDNLIEWSCGPIRYSAEKDTKNTVPLVFNYVRTNCLNSDDEKLPYTKLINIQSKNTERHQLIKELVEWVWGKWKQPIIVVTMRVSHSYTIQELLSVEAEVISAQTKADEREDIYKRIRAGKVPVTIATSNMLSEGVNVPIWTHLILVNDFNDATLVRQVIGRVERAHKIKTKGYVWDLVDKDQFSRAMYNNRAKVYSAVSQNIKLVKFKDGKVVIPTGPKKKRPSIIRPIRKRNHG